MDGAELEIWLDTNELDIDDILDDPIPETETVLFPKDLAKVYASLFNDAQAQGFVRWDTILRRMIVALGHREYYWDLSSNKIETKIFKTKRYGIDVCIKT